jgi:hypothetical protein
MATELATKPCLSKGLDAGTGSGRGEVDDSGLQVYVFLMEVYDFSQRAA